MQNRDRLSSRLGFILLSAGCAIGCGNVWKFPWMAGENGGGIFVLLYIFFLIILGIPVMVMEFSIGRAAQASPVCMYQRLERPGQKWHLHGYLSLFGNICLMSFYTVVAGWMMYYCIRFITGNTEGLSFSAMTANPGVNMGFMAIVVVLGFIILRFGVQGGLERITKGMMVVLLGLMAVLCVNSFTLSGAKEGLSFYLKPDFSKLSWSVIEGAMNQAFFSLSLGIGSMAIFGSYIGKERSLLGESINVVALDTFVAIMAGLIIFPACATYGIEVSQGPGLLFDSMASVFVDMKGGRLWGSVFFLFMVFAAFSTVLTVCENILACVCELTGMRRSRGCILCAGILLLTSSTTALGGSVFVGFVPFAEDTGVLDLWDFIVSANLLPLGAFTLSVFCVSKKWGWGWERLLQEANAGKGLRVRNWMKPVFAYIVPVSILVIYIAGLVTFHWK